MAKITLTDLANLEQKQSVVTAINNNNAAIETAIENTLSRDGSTPNNMESDIDMDSNRILNLPIALNGSEPVRKQEFDAAVLGQLPGTDFAFSSETQSTSPTTGAVTTAGGLGVAKNLNVGGNLGVTGSIDFNGNLNEWSFPAVTATVIGRDTTDTVTNKTINLANNTVTGTIAQFNTALSDFDFATLTGLEALTGKTINAVNNTISNLDTTMFSANTIDTDVNLAANSNTRLATQAAVKSYADTRIAANDAMVFKGVIDASTNPNYPAADRGHTYRISVAGKIGGASGIVVEAGDMILCLTDGTAAGNQATVGANWSVVQTNIDGAVTGPSSSVNNSLPVFNGTSGKVIQDSGYLLPDDDLVGQSSAQPLTNKTFDTSENTFKLNGATVSTGPQFTAQLSGFVGDSGSGGTKGLVPAPVTGDGSKFLAGDGTWTAIPGGGDMLSTNNLSDVADIPTALANLGASPKTRVLNSQTGTTYTFVLTDAGKVCRFSNAGAVTVTIPLNSSVAFPIGTQIDVVRNGAGSVTFTPTGGVTLNAASTASLALQYSTGTLIKVDTDTWLLCGDLTA